MFVYVCWLHCTTERDESLRLSWFVSGWQVPLFSDRNHLLHNLQTQHFVRGKGWQEMRWPYGGMVGPRMECWLTVGRADRGLGPEWMWGWNAVVMGTVKWRWEARWNNFIDHDIYKHNTVTDQSRQSRRRLRQWDRPFSAYMYVQDMFFSLSYKVLPWQPHFCPNIVGGTNSTVLNVIQMKPGIYTWPWNEGVQDMFSSLFDKALPW